MALRLKMALRARGAAPASTRALGRPDERPLTRTATRIGNHLALVRAPHGRLLDRASQWHHRARRLTNGTIPDVLDVAARRRGVAVLTAENDRLKLVDSARSLSAASAPSPCRLAARGSRRVGTRASRCVACVGASASRRGKTHNDRAQRTSVQRCRAIVVSKTCALHSELTDVSTLVAAYQRRCATASFSLE